MHPTPIHFYTRSVYGVETYYCAAHVSDAQAALANAIQRLTCRKTLTATDRQALADMGFQFVRVFPPS